MLTPAYALTASERVLPKLALDFTTGALDPRVSVTRTTGASNPATYIGSDGYIASATNNQPRFDYNPITLTCKGLLIEEARTNLLLQSEDFSAASWTPTGSTIETNVVTAPSNTLTADKWKINSGIPITISALGLFTAGILARLATTSAISLTAVPYTYSLFVAPGSGLTHISLRVGTALDLTGTSYGNIVRLSDGFVVYTDGTTTVQTLKDGWIRIQLTFTPTATTHYIGVWVWNDTSKTTNGTEYITLWGAQLEAGAFATSYIPTTTTSLTRNADVVTMTGTNFSDWYNQAAGTFVMTYLETQNPIIAGGRMLSDTAQLRLPLYQVSTTQLGVYDPSTGGYGYNSGALVAGAVNRGATSWNSTTLYGCTNGGSVVSTSFDGNFDLSGLRIYSAHDNSTYKNGIVQKLAFYPQRLTNAELQAFTK